MLLLKWCLACDEIAYLVIYVFHAYELLPTNHVYIYEIMFLWKLKLDPSITLILVTLKVHCKCLLEIE